MNNIIFYPDNDDPNFYNIINNKKEFRDNALTLKEFNEEDLCNKKNFKVFEHQMLVRNFLSPNTQYQNLLLFHATGLGKTCSSILIAEANMSSVEKVYVFLEKSVKQNYLSEIYTEEKGSNQCTRDQYTKNINSKSLIKNNYNIKQLGKLTNEICKLRNSLSGREKINETYSNSLIIIDEVHNIREYNNPNEKDNICKRYDAIETILLLSSNIKLILMSATPIFDIPQEIVTLANLFLINEKKEKLKVIDIFNNNGDLIDNGKQQIINAFRGKVSYVRGDNPNTFPSYSFQESTNAQYKMNLIKLVETKMSDYQEKNYIEYSKNYFTNINLLRQISNIYIGNKNANIELLEQNLKNKISSVSTKFYKLLKNIKKSIGTNFVYSEFIGQGTELIKKMLLLNGYKLYKPNSPNINSNFIILDGSVDINKRRILIDIFNSEENKYGKIIKILIGSSILKEGITLKNTRQVHIMEPWHNMSRLYQIWGRAIRSCSHIALPKEDRNVKIFLYASIFNSIKKEEPYDISAYHRTILKEEKSQKIIKILRSIALDCGIHSNYNQNTKDKIKCYDLDPIKKDIDKTTYKLYYDFYEKPNIDTMITKIKSCIEQKYYYKLPLKLNKLYKSVIDNIIPKTLDNIEKFKHIIEINKIKGYIIFRKEYLIFQPLNIKNENIEMYDRINSNKKYIEIPFKITEKQIQNKDKEKQIIKKKNIVEYQLKNDQLRGDYLGILMSDNTLKLKLNTDIRSKGRFCTTFNGHEMMEIIKNIKINPELVKEFLVDIPRLKNKSGLCSIITHFFYPEVPINLKISSKEMKPINDLGSEKTLLNFNIGYYTIRLILRMNKHFIRISDNRLAIRTGGLCINKDISVLDDIISLLNIEKNPKKIEDKCNAIKKFIELEFKKNENK